MIRFSIITPVFNGSKYIESLIQSVLQQPYDSFEHIIIDDGSTDDGKTTAILAKYPQVRWWTRANRGQYATMNEGLEAAHGEWICFISADDLMTPGALPVVEEFIEDHPNADIIYGYTTYIDVEGKKYEAQHAIHHVTPRLYPYLLGISHCSMYVRKNILLDNELKFDEKLRYNGDYDWVLSLIRRKLVFAFIDRDLSQVRIHPQRASAIFEKQMIEERRQVFTHYSINPWLYTGASFLMRLHSAISKAISTLKRSGIRATLIRFGRWFREKITSTSNL